MRGKGELKKWKRVTRHNGRARNTLFDTEANRVYEWVCVNVRSGLGLIVDLG